MRHWKVIVALGDQQIEAVGDILKRKLAGASGPYEKRFTLWLARLRDGLKTYPCARQRITRDVFEHNALNHSGGCNGGEDE